MADDIIKIVPNELDANSRYAIRIRSVNSFGVPSAWSESLIVDTIDGSSATGGRLVLTANGLIAYDSNGQTKMVYSGEGSGSRTNLVKNPSFEVDTTGWTANPSTSLSRTTTEFYVGETPYKASLKVTASSASTGIGFSTLSTDRVTVTPGDKVTVSVYIKALVSSVTLKIGLIFYDSGGSIVRTDYALSPRKVEADGLWTRISSIAMIVPNGVAKLGVTIISESEMASGQAYLVDGVLLEQSSTLGDYFDGSTSTGATKWTGTAHYSTSTFDLASAYYVDGGVFTSGTVQTAVDVGVGSPFGKAGVKMSTTGIQGFSGNQATPAFSLATDGKFRVGSLSKYMYWNGEELTVKGAINGTDFNLLNSSDQIIASLGPTTSTNFGSFTDALVFNNLDHRTIQPSAVAWSQVREFAITSVVRDFDSHGAAFSDYITYTAPGHTFTDLDYVEIFYTSPGIYDTSIALPVVDYLGDSFTLDRPGVPGVPYVSGGKAMAGYNHKLALIGPKSSIDVSPYPAEVNLFSSFDFLTSGIEIASGDFAGGIGTFVTNTTQYNETTQFFVQSSDLSGSQLAEISTRAGSGAGATFAKLAATSYTGGFSGVSAEALGSVGTVSMFGDDVDVDSEMNMIKSGGGRKIVMAGDTSNWIEFNTAGTAIPTVTTRSAGTKIVLYPAISGSATDYALGIASSTLWMSVPTTSSDFIWYVGTTVRMKLDGSANALVLEGTLYANGVTVAQHNTTSNPGLSYSAGSFFAVSRDQATCIVANTQNTAGGTINPFQIQTGTTVQGGLAMTTGGVVSVAAFAGMHWSQLQSGVSRWDIPFGTILETVDELCYWPEDDTIEDRLARFKVSDTPASNAVYGVFVDWNDFGEDADINSDDGNIMSLGAYFVRIAPGEVVACGDYIESNGDGCGRVQADNIMRASTVAKITSTIRRNEYPDGSYVVPCTLHCG